jgi:hypothetical protein
MTANTRISNGTRTPSYNTLGRGFLLACLGLLALAGWGRAAEVLVEAESFADLGGWTVDAQFMDQMGSPYLLAHGLGKPVAPAETEVVFPETGEYRVWVRTKDWVARWNVPGAPGRFTLAIDGRELPTVFGTQGAAWHWQDGGQVVHRPAARQAAVARPDRLRGPLRRHLFVKDPGFVPRPITVRRVKTRSKTPAGTISSSWAAASRAFARPCARLAAAVKKRDWLRADEATTRGMPLVARCLSQFLHRLAAA